VPRKPRPTMTRVLLLVLALSPLAVRAQSAGAVAGLQQDVSALRDEVRLLRAEIEEVKEAQTRIQAANTPAKTVSGSADLSTVNARIAAVEADSAAKRKSDKADVQAELNQLSQRITALQSGVNKALADQTKQVNEALRSGSTARPTETPATPATPKPDVAKPVEPPADMPKTGARHTVVSGDSVSKIAKKMNSKAPWILAANGLRSNADLKAGAVIFVPQVETAAKSE
jgi:LysM repeat protein